jgi:hypothetical protein
VVKITRFWFGENIYSLFLIFFFLFIIIIFFFFYLLLLLLFFFFFFVFYSLHYSNMDVVVVNETRITLDLLNGIFTDDDKYYALFFYGKNFEQRSSPVRLLMEETFLFLY